MSGNDAVKTLAAKAHGLRECSVLLYRLEQIGHRPQLELKDDAKRVFGIKIEADCEEVVVKQELDAEHVVKPDPDVPEVDGFVLKMKQEMDEVIKQELDIGPTVLQSRAAIVAGPDPRPSTSFVIGASSAPLCTTLTQPATRTDDEDDYHEKDSGVASSNVDRSALREHSHERSHGKDESMGTQPGDQGSCSTELSNEHDRRTDESRAKTNRQIAEKQHKRDYSKCSTMGKPTIMNDINTRINRKWYKCGQCEYIAFQLTHLKLHMRAHTDNKLYECDHCKYSTSKKRILIMHMRNHTGDKPYKCGQCSYRASQIDNFRRHMRIHTGVKPYKCKYCDYSACEQGTLKMHIRTHTGERPYKCKHCAYSASQPSPLKIHMRIHTGDKPYKCGQCKYRASQLTHLKRHMCTHTGEKPYKCERCGFSASQVSTLKTHTRTHTLEKPYKCKQCDYSASQQGSLKIHMRTHTGEKPYKCKQCEYSASQVSNLRKHMRVHAGEKPVKKKNKPRR